MLNATKAHRSSRVLSSSRAGCAVRALILRARQSVAVRPALSVDIAHAVYAAAAALPLIYHQRAARADVVAVFVATLVAAVGLEGVVRVRAIDSAAAVIGTTIDANAAFAADG